ncbi:MAG TPA: hypothetical protein PKD26_06015 [Pyrinomonadaceae bacterium]|nr:hypothetical protein [Pyrinomonadaceae bacterium]
MKRIHDKVKDIVEVRPFRSIRDFTADPVATLQSYHFTDATAELMAKWLDAISGLQPGKGEAFALAGYRGVGKSHFLATLGALASSPELREQVSESHVEYSAQRLQRRHYPVSYLRRGTHADLLEELKVAAANTFQLERIEALSTFEEVLNAVAAKNGETPWVLLIDTAMERGSRVTRDDGEALSEIAATAQTLNLFVGVALDDDIAGADGSNAAIVRSFAIDYLDQAHLYKVVNAHVFPKNSKKLGELHEIYGYFREVLPSFRWSEQKFSSLYPLHPAILEVAPYVRLYVQDFALLGFASEAGEKILGRPANSLIALDEVFDSAESGLRKIDDLSEAFAAYDSINSSVVNKIPVMQRLQAKLILKALLLLSLDGQGATASEICASELVFDEADPQKAAITVEALLRRFADELQNDIRVVADDATGARYSFKVSSKENLNNELAEAVLKIADETISGVLRRVFSDRFPDAQSGAGSDPELNEISTQLVWRGTRRPGRLVWHSALNSEETRTSDPWIDWEVEIDLSGSDLVDGSQHQPGKITWKPDPLRPDEIDKIKSYFILSTNVELREKYSEQIRASLHAHSIAAEKILNRCFLEDGKLVVDGFDYNFTEEARSAQSLPELFGTMLEPLFESRYPAHPFFTKLLEYHDVAEIVTDLYNESRRDLADTQSRAQTFAFPLGLVRLEGTSFVPEDRDRLAALPTAKLVNDLVAEDVRTVPIERLQSELRQPPHGFGREAQQMLLTALAAERFLDFVTKSGNRISSRSLDLKIIWDDIAGIARPLGSTSNSQTHAEWAKLFLKGRASVSLDQASDREALTESFRAWVEQWDKAGVLEHFSELPEDVLNVRVWQLAARASKTFGGVVEKIRGAGNGGVSLEECLDSIFEAFSGSTSDLEKGEADLKTLESFVRGAALRDEVKTYLAMCELTADSDIEMVRERTITILNRATRQPSEDSNRELGYAWEKFRRSFSENFEREHLFAASHQERRQQLSQILKSDAWAEFEIVSRLPGFDRSAVSAIDGYRRRIHDGECTAKTTDLLERQPFCHCNFSLMLSEDLDHLPSALNDAINKGLVSFRVMLNRNAEDIIRSIEKFSDQIQDNETESACRGLASALKAGKDIPRFDDLQLKILTEVLRTGTVERPDLSVKTANGPHPATLGTNPVSSKAKQEQEVDELLLLNV